MRGQKGGAGRGGDAHQPVGGRLELDQARPEEQRRDDDGAGHCKREADEDDPARDGRPVAAIGEVGDQEGEGIGEGAPGQDVGQREVADASLHGKLDQHV